MANDLSARPIKVDSTMGSASTTGITVRKVIWVAPTTAAHTFNIHDGSSGTKTLLTGVCDAANKQFIFDFMPPVRWKQWQCNTLGSGILYIFAD